MHKLTLFWYFLALLCGVTYLRYQVREWIHTLVNSSTVAYCDAKMHLEAWRRKNPHVFPAYSEEGRALVIHTIHTYEDFLYLHSFCDDEGYLDELCAMLIDLNPTPPGKRMRPTAFSQLAPASCVFIHQPRPTTIEVGIDRPYVGCMFVGRHTEEAPMVRITAQQVTDAWGRAPLLEDVFTSDMRARAFESVKESVFEDSIPPRGQQTLAELRLTDKFSLLATYLITHGHSEHERVTYGLHKNIKMILIGTTEFRVHKHSIYQRTVEE